MSLLRCFCISLVLLVAPLFNQSPAAENRPNVVFILSDDQAWGDYSFMGHPSIETPRLDELAARSATFTRGYVPDSLCRPSLATIISGLYPHQHGIVGNDPPLPEAIIKGGKNINRGAHYRSPQYVAVRNQYLRHATTMQTLPEMLSPLGYRSMQSGKWWEGGVAVGGFDEGMTVGDFSKNGRHGDDGLKIGRDGMEPVLEFLSRSADSKQPFFLWYAPMLPHTPHDPPADLLAKYQARTDSMAIAKYWANCERFDQSCGQLIDALDDNGLTDNTIIMYVTDNGWINQVHESAYAPRSKRSPNEGGTRTPIMVCWPGKITPRLDTTHLASSIDMVPTICSLLGPNEGLEKAAAGLPGINLLDESVIAKRDTLYGEIFEHDIVAMDDPAASLMYRWVIEGNYKLIDPSSRLAGESPQLYRLDEDPAEDHDLAGVDPDRVARLTAKLDAWYAPPTR